MNVETKKNQNKRRRIWGGIKRLTRVFAAMVSLFAAVLGILSYYDTAPKCYLLGRQKAADNFLNRLAETGVDAYAKLEDQNKTLKFVLGYEEQVGFDQGGQIFDDIQRISAIRNAARFLVNEIIQIESEKWPYVASVVFRGGADGIGKKGNFRKPLSIGSIVISVPYPLINGRRSSETPVFASGQTINNEDLSLVRAGFVSSIFLNEIEVAANPPVFDRDYIAETFEEIGPEHRYGRMEIRVSINQSGPKVPKLPFGFESILSSFALRLFCLN